MGRRKRKYRPKPKCHPHCKRGRHVFTRAECAAGFQAAIVSIIARYPNAVDSAGRHMVCKFLRAKNPLWFEVRKLETQLKRLQQGHRQADARLTAIERELAQLKKGDNHGRGSNKG